MSDHAPAPRIRLRDYPARFLELAGPIGVGLGVGAAFFLALGFYLNDEFGGALFAAPAAFFVVATLAIVVRWLWACVLALLGWLLPRPPPGP
jgi:drug/metabolite transporter (DMT)-like permease